MYSTKRDTCISVLPTYAGLMLTLNGSIISNGSHIRIADVGTTDNNALSCMSESFLTGGTWYLHPTQLSTNESDEITPVTVDRGWHSRRGTREVRLWRDSTNMDEEGIFTCQFMIDRDTFVSVAIYLYTLPVSLLRTTDHAIYIS